VKVPFLSRIGAIMRLRIMDPVMSVQYSGCVNDHKQTGHDDYMEGAYDRVLLYRFAKVVEKLAGREHIHS